MEIVSQDDRRIVFARAPLGARIAQMFGASIAIGFGTWVPCIAVRGIDQALVTASFGAAAFILLFALVGLVFLGAGLYMLFFALPFRLELHREPIASCYTWRNWAIRRVSYAKPDAVVHFPAAAKRSWPFALGIRTGATRRTLLVSHRAWRTEGEAYVAGRQLAAQVAEFIGCQLEDEEWSDAATVADPDFKSRFRILPSKEFVIAVGVLIALRIGWDFSPPGDRGYLEDTTGLRLPFWPEILTWEDNGENLLLAHIRLPPAKAQRLARGPVFHLATLPASHEVPQRILDRFKPILSKHNDAYPSSKSFRVLDYCTPGSDADGLLDENTGDLWVSIRYTDWSGDPPGCL